MDSAPRYTHRRHVFEAEKTIAIEGDTLTLRENGKEKRLKLAEVSKLRLAFEPSRAQSDLYVCRIFKKGWSVPWTVLNSQSFRGFLDFEDRAPAYRTFVRALNDAVLANNPNAEFLAGASMAGYVANAAALAVATILFAIVIFITQGEGWSDVTWNKLWLTIGMIPLGVIWFMRNRPRTYDPRALPDDLLPSGEPRPE